MYDVHNDAARRSWGGYAESGNTAAMQPTRTTMLDLTSTTGKYMATDGKEKTDVDPFRRENSGDGADLRTKLLLDP